LSESIDIVINARDHAMGTLRDLNRQLQETGRLNKDQMQTLRQVRQEVDASSSPSGSLRKQPHHEYHEDGVSRPDSNIADDRERLPIRQQHDRQSATHV